MNFETEQNRGPDPPLALTPNTQERTSHGRTTKHLAFWYMSSAYLSQEVAGTVDDLGLSSEAVHALHVAVQLYDARHPVEVAELVCEESATPGKPR